MSWLPEIKQRILAATMIDRLDHYQIAADLGEAPFRVRAELQDLRRDRLVVSRVEGRRIIWVPTGKGLGVGGDERQTELEL